MNVLSLFSGIGGLDLGLQRAGMTICGQVEIDPWCRKVLAKHWPEVPRHDDVRTCAEWLDGMVADAKGDRRRTWRQGRSAGSGPDGEGHAPTGLAGGGRGRPRVDLVCGGFPCQPVSYAGKGLAQADSRWLWPAFASVVRHLRPAYVLVENVPGLLGRGMGDVLGDLAALGYDAEWDSIPAAFKRAPHIRNRVWIVAYPAGNRPGRLSVFAAWDDPGWQDTGRQETPSGATASRQALADAAVAERRTAQPQGLVQAGWRTPESRERDSGGRPISDWWAVEPGVGRVAHGVPGRVDRLRGLGNAVVPQVAEHIGHLIMAAGS
jgi:DNA (cytosine-5)-methyltransferase 1